MEAGPLNLDEIEARANAATPGPWEGKRNGGVYAGDMEPVFETGCGCCSDPDLTDENSAFIASARTDVPALIARVRELETQRDGYARSHLILKAIHGALTDALPSTPIPALDSFDVVEMVRNIVSERDQALADYQDLGRVMHEECARLEAECERMKTFAAKSFSQMMCQEVEQMREYGLSYEGVRKILHEYNDGEISFGKLMDLIRAAARAMAEDMQK